MAKVTIAETHRTIGDLSKPAADVPTGVWHELRAIKLSKRDITMQPKGSEEYETVEYTLSVEPIRPGPSVNPDELEAKDERTGKPTWDGKRIFCRFKESFRSDMVKLGKAMEAMGFDSGDDFDVVVAQNLVRGRTFSGDVRTRTYTRNDGTPGSEQFIDTYAKVGAGVAAFTL